MNRILIGAWIVGVHGLALAGYGGMGSVDSSDTGGVPFSGFVLGILALAAFFYGSVKFAERFEGNLGYGYIAIAILIFLVLSSVFG